ncbi:DUF1826 domain-containing protein [Acetobacter fallax]|uniref:DUF1826 domain-containing protein n=1 Tax=Acetobacter fallax TaxID=1737473 RepID=A0ABX0KAW1_9PROT|nr:DUF1826 domain-containing protein [Acetobacter fallax]NHO33564.1 DUF1826 domain-containing protein [Acetobacter fallax]NHO36533.1 DUF1826 domain-containing protein [Acetobacter fallax]
MLISLTSSLPCSTRARLSVPPGLSAIREIGRSIAVCERALSSSVVREAAEHVASGPAVILARGTAEDVRRLITPEMTENSEALLSDAAGLVSLYQRLTGLDAVRFRLERVMGDSCRRFHIDNVGLRLLCAYIGPGVQWTSDKGETIQEAATGSVVLLKGRRWPGWSEESAVLHRSPPLSALPVEQRVRLLLTIDEPDACGMSADQPLVVTV